MSEASAAAVSLHEWLPNLEESASEVFNLMLNSNLRRGSPQMFPAPECTAMVGVAGSIRGVLTVRCGGATANELAATMLKLPPARAAHYAADALGEIANMVAGNFKNKADNAGGRSFLSLPTVVTGMTYTCRSLSSAVPLELWFQFRGEPLQITMEVQL
jgi:chemotaxis protein CheX